MDNPNWTRPPTESDLTQLLVSVRNAEEAMIVSRYPVGILDVKEPNRGALGAPDPLTLRQISQVVSNDQTLSFAAGELSQWIRSGDASSVAALSRPYEEVLRDFRYIKVGLAGMRCHKDWRRQWQSFFRSTSQSTSAVMVAYFDHDACQAPNPECLIAFAATQENCFTILFDTYGKSQNLFAYATQEELATLVRNANCNGLQTVVAGSVDQSCLADVIAVNPDFIGVRGAVCRNGRTTQVDGSLVSELASNLQAPMQN